MQPLHVCQIDAFTARRYQGNPAGVVANAEGPADAQMQLIARQRKALAMTSARTRPGARARRCRRAPPADGCGRATGGNLRGRRRLPGRDRTESADLPCTARLGTRVETGEPVGVRIEGRAMPCLRTTLPRDAEVA